jgi:hypothetical protein
MRRNRRAYLEEVKEGAAVDTRLLVRAGDNRRLLVLLRVERGRQVELEALGNVVLDLDLGAEDVRGCPRLGEDEAVGLVRVLGLDVARNAVALRVTHTSDAEGRVALGLGLDLERRAVEGEVFAEQVAGRLAQVLRAPLVSASQKLTSRCIVHLPRRRNGLGKRHLLRRRLEDVEEKEG